MIFTSFSTPFSHINIHFSHFFHILDVFSFFITNFTSVLIETTVMNKFYHFCLSFAMAAMALLSSCSDPSFTVKGEISGAKDKTLTLETADRAGYWVPVDSTRLGPGGKFSFKGAAPAAPDIYRLRLDGQYIYFPIDSIESINISASAAGFARDFELSGSDNALALAKFEKELLANSAKLENPDSAIAFKRHVYTAYLRDARGSVVSYYILTKTINDKPLFDPTADVSYFAAVATAFHQYCPEDPRTLLLERTATEGRRRLNAAAGKKTVMHAQEISYIPISLPDASGTNVPLSDLAGQGAPVAILFTDPDAPETPALNMEIKKLVESGALKVYNVGFSADMVTWRNAARNLPWTCVYADPDQATIIASQYQVTRLPAIFLINSAGELSGRYSDASSLAKALR